MGFNATHLYTNRLKYFTNVIEVFIAHSGPKMSYGAQPLGSEFFIKSNGLLFEQGLSDVKLVFKKWEKIQVFFMLEKKVIYPLIFFSAAFFY